MDPLTNNHRHTKNGTANNGSSRDSDRTSHSPPNSIPSLERRNSTTSPAESELFDFPYRASAETYCTTVASFDEYEDDSPAYDYYDYYNKTPRNEAVPATPNEFADLFPSFQRMEIKHDDSSSDGDMNIRVDTIAKGRHGVLSKRLTLFHLRMYDLEKREFSLRRYGRDCGREVAHTHQKFEKHSTARRPTLQRSVSKAFHSFRGKAEQEKQMTLQRQDSGYGSEDDDDVFSEKATVPEEPQKPTNTITLEFSNYAHVELHRKGTKMTRKYDFEYWGKNYSWKRLIRRAPATGVEETHFQLVNNGNNNVVAAIVPDNVAPFSGPQDRSGEFVPQCSFVFRDTPHDPIIGLADVADTIMATGLMALVDDCIKRKFEKKKVVQLAIPTPIFGNKLNLEYVGPKRLIDEVFNRRPSLQARSVSTPAPSTTSRTPTPTQCPTRRR